MVWRMFRADHTRQGYAGEELDRLRLAWVKRIGECVSSPIVSDEVLYITNMYGVVYAIDIHTSNIIWRSELKIPVVSSPIIHDNIIYLATFNTWFKGVRFKDTNYIVALDNEEGKIRWKRSIDSDIFASPVIIDDLLIVGALDGSIYAIDNYGEIRWIIHTGGAVWSSPSLLDDSIIIGSDDNHLYKISKDGAFIRKVRLDGKVRSCTPCITLDSILIGTFDGSIYSLDHDMNTRWKKSAKSILASPSYVDDHIIFASADNCVYCFDDEGNILWRFNANDQFWASPAVTDKHVIVSSLDSNTYMLNIKNGGILWKFPSMDMIDSSPCISDDMLFVASRDGVLYAFTNLTS